MATSYNVQSLALLAGPLTFAFASIMIGVDDGIPAIHDMALITGALFFVFSHFAHSITSFGIVGVPRVGLGPIEGTLTIVVVGTLSAVSPFVVGSLQNGLNTSGLPSAAKVSIGNIFQQIYNALGIVPLVLVILALVVILSAVFLLVPRRSGMMLDTGGSQAV
jgi:hypothetical protein